MFIALSCIKICCSLSSAFFMNSSSSYRSSELAAYRSASICYTSSPAPAASCCIYRDCFHPYKSLRKSSISDRKYLLSSVTFYALATSYSIAAFSLRKFSSLYICATKPSFVVSSGSESDLSSSSPAPIA